MNIVSDVDVGVEAVTGPLPSATQPPAWGRFDARALLARYGVVIVLAGLTIVFCVWMPDTFATAGNFRTMVNSQAILLLLALTATLVLRTGDFDLSVAAAMTLSASAVAVLSARHHWPLLGVLLIAAGIGLAVGLINGFLVVKLGVEAFIVTLGMLTALGGLAYWVTDSRVISGVPKGVLAVARHDLLGLPLATWYAWGLAVVLWYVYERTPLGRYLLFIGGSRESARLAGIRVDRLRMLTFVASSVLAGLTGFLLAGQLGAMDPSIGGQYLLRPFAAAFLGATTVKVGRFNAMGTVVGLYLLVVGITGLQLLGVDSWVSDLFNGAALVAAVTLSKLAGRGRS